MADSVFTKIIKGEVPSYKVYEDESTYAFMDIRPLNPGHVLVITKQETDHIWDLDLELYQHLMETTKKVALRIQQVLRPPRVGMNVEGFGVPHVHVHVYPLYKGLESTMAEYIAKADQQAPDEELAEMAKKLAF
ncbi:MAG TPA: HIT family protein [Candidatus Saccharimonadales bacterium]|nr:HIT family protein [Candidatus Saccharimonadales bacterium]